MDDKMNRIKEILEEKGIKQTWLADRLNKSYNMLNSYVQNRRQPSIKDLFKIAEILKVEPSELITNNGLVEAKWKSVIDFDFENILRDRHYLLLTLYSGKYDKPYLTSGDWLYSLYCDGRDKRKGGF